jgi:transcriptional regulator with XRE-family HTH domain
VSRDDGDSTGRTDAPGTAAAADVALGRRLRAIRRQKGWSLNDTQTRTQGEFRASVLGAYERGERSVSVPRLLRLAELYDVPVADLLEGSGRRLAAAGGQSGFPIDLDVLARAEGPEVSMLRRMVRRLQVQRQDFGGRVLTIRGDDMRVLAAALGREPDELERLYEAQGLRSPS